MVTEPILLGTVGSSLFGVLAVLRWWFRNRTGDVRGSLIELAETCLDGHLTVLIEQARRATMVAAIGALPPGGCLISRRADEILLVCSAPSASVADQRLSTDEPDGNR